MAEDGRKFTAYDDPDGDEAEDEAPPPLSLRERLEAYRDANAEKAFFYATVFCSLMAISAFFGFLFLVPFVIEPAVTTMQMDFVVEPVTCCVVSFRNESGAKMCDESWSSCREGCTKMVYECVKVLVAYTDAPNFTCSARPPNHQWLHDHAKLFPNVKGCGYPPSLNCTTFAQKYRKLNTTLPCYYSRVDAELVITSLDPSKLERDLVTAIVLPFVCFVAAVAFLVHAYRRMQRRDAAAAAAAAAELAEQKAACLDGDDDVEPTTSRSNPNSSYSLKSITSKINSTVVRFARDRRQDSGSGDEIEMEEVREPRPPSRYLQPGRLPSGTRRHLLPPLEPTDSPADEGAAASASASANSISPVET